MRRRLALAAAAAISLAVTACSGSGAKPAFRPSLREVMCPADVTSAILTPVTCWYLTVLEDRSKPDGRTIQLFAFRIEPPDGNPSPDPMFSAGYELAEIPSYASIGPMAQRTHRDVILLDQRGTGHSRPSLACPEVRHLTAASLSNPISAPSVREDLKAAAKECYDRLVKEGVDPSAYTLDAAASDIEDLRRALGIQRWNLISHGTVSRILFEVMRRFPAHVRTVVLDDPQFPQMDELTEGPTDLGDAMNQLAAACAAQDSCSRAFPDLLNAFTEAMARLQSRPITVEVAPSQNGTTVRVVVDGGAFVRAIRVMVADDDLQLASEVPFAVYSALDGNVDVVASLLANDPSLCVGYLPRCERYPYSEGTYYSYLCHDEAPFVDRSGLADAVRADPGLEEAYGLHPYLDICERWPVGKADPLVHQAVVSNIPTLIFHGDFDAFSPRSEVEQAGSTLSTSFVVVGPSLGHDLLTFDCFRNIRNAWVDDPTSAPDTSCTDELPGVVFETSSG